MGTPEPTLPPLSPHEHALLLALLDAEASLTEVAKKHSVDDILTLVSSPAIRAALCAIADFNHLRAAAISSDRRVISLEALSDIAAATTDPLERRRAATAFLRALALRSPSSQAPTPAPPASPAESVAPAAAAAPSPPPHTAPPTTQPNHSPVTQSAIPIPQSAINPHSAIAPPLDLAALLSPSSIPSPSALPHRPRRPTTASLAAAAGAIPTG